MFLTIVVILPLKEMLRDKYMWDSICKWDDSPTHDQTNGHKVVHCLRVLTANKYIVDLIVTGN